MWKAREGYYPFVAKFHFWVPKVASQSSGASWALMLRKLAIASKLGFNQQFFLFFSLLWVLACVGNKRKLSDPCNEFTFLSAKSGLTDSRGLLGSNLEKIGDRFKIGLQLRSHSAVAIWAWGYYYMGRFQLQGIF